MTDVPQDCPATRELMEWAAAVNRLVGMKEDGAIFKYPGPLVDAMRDELLGKLARRDAIISSLNGDRDNREAYIRNVEAALAEARGYVQMALDELGVPDENYPAPVANAVAFLREVVPAPPAEEAQDD